jgi:hypothetical protein
MIQVNRASAYVAVKSTKKGSQMLQLTIDAKDFNGKEKMTVRIFPENELKKDKNGNDFLLASVSQWDPKEQGE